MKFLKTSNQIGSASLASIAALTAIATAGAYIFQAKKKVSDEVFHARVKMANESANQSNMNILAQFKALLNNGKVGNDYVPALFPANYWLANWQQVSKNPDITSDDVELGNANEWIKLSMLDTGDLNSGQLKSVLKGQKRMTSLKPQNGFIRIIQANFKRSANFDYVESVDVEVKTTKVEKDQSSTIISKARIPIPIPQPSNPILELSPAGQNQWTTQLNSAGTGNYDIRVLASGVVYKAELYVNNHKISEFSAFDADTGEPNKHAATNVLAKKVVVGQTTYAFQGGFVGDAASCSMAPAGGNYTIKAVLYNAKGEVSEAQLNTTEQTFATTGGSSADLTDEEFKAACPTECPWFTDWHYKNYATDEANKGLYPDYSHPELLEIRNTTLKVKSVKLCENIKVRAEKFFEANGRRVENWGEYMTGDWSDITYVYYTVPDCKKNFLFQRTACGCFSEETMITLGDGSSQKKITELTDQDLVWNPVSKKSQAIARMTQGPEAVPMFEIKVDNKQLRVTGQHPFMTKTGLKPMFELKVGDLIPNDQGTMMPVQSIHVIKADKNKPIVWNLELAGASALQDHYVLANGIITGDLYIQTRLQDQKSSNLASDSSIN